MDFINKYRGFTIFYFFLFIANFVFLDVLTDYRMVSKPMIMASLLGFYIGNVPKQSNTFIMALIFALFGDIFLMVESDDFFMLGLGSFLLMQLLYGYNFLQDRITDIKSILYKALPVILVAIGIITYLYNDLGTMLVPVMFYTLAISLMVIAAMIRKPSIVWYLPVVVGVIFFLVSDAAIAFSKFGNVTGNSMKYLIIGTYMIAQYLIVRGIVEQKDMLN